MAFWHKWFVPKPFNDGYLPELDGHEIYFREFGKPQGEVILTFHGGPGFWSRPEKARDFDLKKYRVIQFDQRGCGKSKPAGKLENNTTQDNVEDAARLLNYLKINGKIILFGGSWGSTMALMFAERYPDLVKCMILSKIFLANDDSRKWELKDSVAFYPDILEAIRGDLADNDLIPEYYLKLISSDDASQQAKAASLYGSLENFLGCLNPQINMHTPDEKELAMLRVYIYYAARRFMMKDDEIIENSAKIKHIPSLIVHNRLDFICPPVNAYRLHKALPMSKLVIVPDKGHSSKMLSDVIIKEMNEFLLKYGDE